MGEEPEHWPAARGFTRDLTLIPGGGSHFDDMWGAKGEKQLYTQNGKVLELLRPGFHSSDDYTAAIIGNIEENRATESRSSPIWRCRRRTIRSICPMTGSTSTRAVTITATTRRGGTHRAHEDPWHHSPPSATVFPRLPNVPTWADLSDEERRQSARKMELYAAMVEHMDANIGKLTGVSQSQEHLRQHADHLPLRQRSGRNQMNMEPPWDNRNYEKWGKKGTFIQYGAAWAQVSAGPISGCSRDSCPKEAFGTPMIMAGQAWRGSGRISNAVTHVMDVPATILTVANVAHPIHSRAA